MAKQSRIELRERSLVESWDLSLVFLRNHFKSIFFAALPGFMTLVVAVYLMMLLGPLQLIDVNFEYIFFWLTILLGLLIFGPLMFLPLTAWMGEAVFEMKPKWSVVLARCKRALPPLLLVTIIRALPALAYFLFMDWKIETLSLLVFVNYIYCGLRVFVGEVIILEGASFKRSRKRMRILAKQDRGSALSLQFVELAVLFVVFWMGVLCSSELHSWFYKGSLGLFNEPPVFSIWSLSMLFLIALIALIWSVIGVVRIFVYLSQRSYTEGWEIETELRLAASHLSGEQI